MIILGIDPGLAIMGYGVIETDGSRHRLVQYGALTTEAKTPMPSRLLSIHTGVEQLLAIYKPDQIALEELFFAKNVTTGIAVGEARGEALVAAARYTQELYEYTPMQVKQAVTGTGRADKTQVQAMVRAILSMRETPKPDDAADALAVAITHAHSMRAGALFKIV